MAFKSTAGNREQWLYFSFLIPALLMLTVFFLWPLISFLQQSLFDPDFTLRHYARMFQHSVYLIILYRTLEISLYTTLGCLVIGYPVAWAMANSSPKISMIITALVIIPFWTSVLVRTYAWMVLLGNNGVINNLLLDGGLIHSPLSLLFNRFSVLVGMIHTMLPYMILPLYAVMKGIPDALLQASTGLGAPPLQTFYRVYLPLTLPGIATGCLLVFIVSLGFFVTPALLGGPQDTMLSQIIEQEINQTLNWGFAAALSTLLLLVTIVLYWLYDRFIDTE